MISTTLTPRRSKKKNNIIYSWVAALFTLLLLLGGLMGWLWARYNEYIPFGSVEGIALYYDGMLYKEKAVYQGNALYVPYELIKECVDPNIKWDENNDLVIITTRNDVYHLYLYRLEILHNMKEEELVAPAIIEQGKVYLPLDVLNKVYTLEVVEKKDQGVVTVHNIHESLLNGILESDARLRSGRSHLTPWYALLKKDDRVKIFKDEGKWFCVESETGDIGYVEKDRVVLEGITDVKSKPNIYQPYNPMGVPILLTWEYAGTKTTSTNKIGKLPGVRILSPTWFDLEEGGVVSDRADSKYIDWAHKEGFKVWGVFSNNTQIELTHNFLSDSALRMKAIGQLLEYIDKYQLDGLDIDFEYMYMKDKDSYVQFIRELTPLVHEKGLSVNVYLIFHSNSENWSLCYDHKALADTADYVTVMAYDEHTHLAGSVASFPWVERGIKRMLQDVSNEKLILGIPLYTRLWREEFDGKGDLKTTRQTLSLDAAGKWVNEQDAKIVFDNQVGQNYLEIVQEEAVYKMWLEDNFSLEKRVEMAKKYRLAGIAAWRRGLEKEDTWSLLSSLLDKRW